MFEKYIDSIANSTSTIEKVGNLLGLDSPVTIYALLNDSMDPRFHGKFPPAINWKTQEPMRNSAYAYILQNNSQIHNTVDGLTNQIMETRHYMDRVLAELSDDIDMATTPEAVAKILKQIESYSLSAQHKLLLVIDSYYVSSRHLGIKENDLRVYKNIYTNMIHQHVELDDQLAYELATFGDAYKPIPNDPYKLNMAIPLEGRPEPKYNKLD